jgi:Holliday junction resolvase
MRRSRRAASAWVLIAIFALGCAGAGGASMPGADETGAAIARIRDAQHVPVPNPVPQLVPGAVAEGLVVENKTGYTLKLYLKGPIVRTIVLDDRDFSAVAIAPGTYEIAAEAVDARILPFYSLQVYQARVRYSLTFWVSNPIR